MSRYLVNFAYPPQTLIDQDRLRQLVQQTVVPPSIQILDTYRFQGQRRGFIIAECSDTAALENFAKQWRNHLDLEILPIQRRG